MTVITPAISPRKEAIMTTGTTGRTALLLALMKTGDDMCPGQPGALPGLSHPQGRSALWSRLLSGLVGCRR